LSKANKTASSAVPTKGLLSAWQVLSWIAFREIRRTTSDEDLKSLADQWGGDSPPRVLQALKARAGEEPYCVLSAVTKYDGLDRFGSRAYGPNGPSLLRRIAVQVRRRERRWLTLDELARKLDGELELLAKNEKLLRLAWVELADAMKGARLITLGRHRRSATDIAIPTTILPDSEFPVTDLQALQAYDQSDTLFPQYVDIQFYAAEVLRCWPSDSKRISAPAPAASPKHGHTLGGAPPRYDWESFWIEVVLYAAKHDLDLEHRNELHRHMCEWAAQNWPAPPDDATVRNRMAKLFAAFNARENESRAIARGSARENKRT
jgi:hypothetical protein